MPLRAQTRIACQRCRKKRIKCDREVPCSKCVEVDESCDYEQNRRISKGELRAEAARLRADTDESDKVLRAIASITDPLVCKRILQGLMDGTLTRMDVIREYRSESASSTGPSPGSSTSRPTLPRADSSSCFGDLRSWRACRPNILHANIPLNLRPKKTQSTILSLPPLPLDAHRAHAQADTWTRTGWTKAHVRHLMDALRTWDYLPFCIFSEQLFLRDYDSGANQFCSSALVHAVLALSTRIINETSDDGGLLPSGWKRSNVFFDEASGMLQTAERLDTLPDVQALGILSLYVLRCGREAYAQELADKFAASIADLCRRVPSPDQDYARAQKLTYCGAVTLVRMLAMATGRLFNVPDMTDQEDLFSLDRFPSGNTNTPRQGGLAPVPSLGAEANSRLWNVQLIATSLFQLTEWTYRLVVAAQTDPQSVSSEVPATYARCLGWYNDFFSLLPPEGGRTPFVLFVHMYYHFCLLCAFRPFVHLVLEGSDFRPDEICIQASQSILGLGQSYEDLFTLRRVSGLIPYFICASGLFSLGMEEGGSHIDDVHLRPGDEASFTSAPNPAERELFATHGGTKLASSFVRMSAVSHARLLLAKISSTHPAATVADKMLWQEMAYGSASGSQYGADSLSPMEE